MMMGNLFRALLNKLGKKQRPAINTIDTPSIPNSGLSRTWGDFNRKGKVISYEKSPLVTSSSKIFAMGSCFAVEIRKALKDLGYNIYPEYGKLKFKRSLQKAGTLPARENINQYNTFSILQEFEKAFGLWKQGDNDYWFLKNNKLNDEFFSEKVYQDPYRRLVFAKNKEMIIDLTRKLDELIKRGIEESDIYIITLGMTEVWKKKDNGLYACTNPGYGGSGGAEETEFVSSSFHENYTNVKKMVELILSHYPEKHIILTVSPIPLGSTFTGQDVCIANMQSKTTLRAVTGQITKEFDNVKYFPSLEICSTLNAFEEDGRHVTPDTVKFIVNTFLDMFCKTT